MSCTLGATVAIVALTSPWVEAKLARTSTPPERARRQWRAPIGREFCPRMVAN
jgi:hypothetical protein